jgi:hypothetical protein
VSEYANDKNRSGAANSGIASSKSEERGMTLNELLRFAFEAPTEATEKRSFYETATPEEWVREFTKWAKIHGPNTPGLTLEDLSREKM